MSARKLVLAIPADADNLDHRRWKRSAHQRDPCDAQLPQEHSSDLPCSHRRRHSIPTMVVQHVSLLHQQWVATTLHLILPAPRRGCIWSPRVRVASGLLGYSHHLEQLPKIRLVTVLSARAFLLSSSKTRPCSITGATAPQIRRP